MSFSSFSDNLDFKDTGIATKVILETSFSKEIRILLRRGQTMKEHTAPFPIIVHVLEGRIDFGIQGEVSAMTKGSIITLAENIPHDLTAQEDSIVRLTLSKLDSPDRVSQAAGAQ